MLYKMYVEDTPKDIVGLETAQKDQLCACLADIHLKGIKVTEDPFFDGTTSRIGFYYFSPLSIRKQESREHSRITLTLQSSKVKDVLPSLAEMVRDNPFIRVSKVTGPDYLGTRTDSFIFYLQGTDIGEALKLVEQLNGNSTIKEALIDHTPMGMKSLAPGVSYSEFSSISPIGGIPRSSHGFLRAQIITSAIAKWAKQEDRTKLKLYQYIDKEFSRCGYDPKDSALLSKKSNGARTQ
ncbi:T3SS effector HopA1 family protein [Vibrio aestuarianus]|nr:T3SS effector HopA1 family protein [Vibrio aestuarianus]MDE1214919.1 T3SS effector HopA1 family protein [Vibrio aestuarianus]MDE1219090.1 T3SS effector HopA1 family protein [Vibrio aestuarianus]MDE1229621.1 T3SS effector HopA1 family protein [Vibrio aestuarianus]MDE1258513.1 T3SS effector HopA1 family protein [Vibrio aestuarianus]MDE1260284.1 T3SS effector HopA1 family protein [Vibrio aestuarianus]